MPPKALSAATCQSIDQMTTMILGKKQIIFCQAKDLVTSGFGCSAVALHFLILSFQTDCQSGNSLKDTQFLSPNVWHRQEPLNKQPLQVVTVQVSHQKCETNSQF